MIAKFADIDLHPDVVSNLEMGYLYEELIRRFSELSNETAGEHFTPREVIRLMVNLLFAEDDDILTDPGAIKTIFDPACGTGGMLSVAEDHLRSLNPTARLEVFGQELNDETYAICRSDMMLKGQDASHIVCGNSFSEDGHKGRTFDYMLANPPSGGVEEGRRRSQDRAREARVRWRFGAGLPRINDGSFLFLQHMISKMKPPRTGEPDRHRLQRLAALHRGGRIGGVRDPALDHRERLAGGRRRPPDQLFYNTGISTYFWIVTNRKPPERGARCSWSTPGTTGSRCARAWGRSARRSATTRSTRSPGCTGTSRRREVKIFPNEAFGFQRITVERPLRLRWEVTAETLGLVAETKQWAKLDEDDRKAVEASVSALVGTADDGPEGSGEEARARSRRPSRRHSGMSSP